MNAVLLDTDSLGSGLDFSELERVLPGIVCYGMTEKNDVMERVEHADVVLTNKVVIDAETMASAKHLKLICVLATGTNNVDLETARARGIEVRNVTNYGTASVAQHTLMMMLALATKLPSYQQDVRQGAWEESPFFCLLGHPVTQLAGKTLVIVGSGTLGKHVARLAEAFEMNVHFSARPGSTDDVRPSLMTLLPSADVVSLHCPLTTETEHLIDDAALKAMKPEAFLVNCARGGVIDEKAALSALREKRIAGLAIDVLPEEPPRKGHDVLQALRDEPALNLIVTPHSAWASHEARQTIIELTAKNVIEVFEER
ncbi:D-2-hydroxyacid dehydrogenase [Larsenimonas suaedae]|uniref:D-2-hydroxyacid dehydrogenase n=1 Tax=Larsenimonas suaedae TaxID=1851019 RepID=A0ABU1GX94_9GAMM|nr:D-2-hydroxyacid dehydrogenase [Larsenimonas suaedae]MCM2971372.1 D-2-hydroxyacid dehydrogenase [Larsenimonas suaedae]MDR5896628.1 D-2-hydroxyacid dehydrogenase [Larsenimonas suaedae]